MTDIAYEPPRREYADTLLAFKDFDMSSTWRVRIEPDPLGPVNKIVTLMRGGRRIKSVLWPIPVGAVVRLVRDEGGYSMANLEVFRSQLWDSRGRGDVPAPVDIRPPWPPGWRIEGRRPHCAGRHLMLTMRRRRHVRRSGWGRW